MSGATDAQMSAFADLALGGEQSDVAERASSLGRTEAAQTLDDEMPYSPPGKAGDARFVPLSTVIAESVSWLVPGRVPLSMVTLLAGDPGLGKSTLTMSWAAGVSTGQLGGRASDVLLIGGEDVAATTVRPRAEAAGGNLDRIGVEPLYDEHGDPRDAEIPGDVPRIAALVRERGARLVVIDPLNAHLSAGIDSHKDASLRKALAPLSRLAADTGAAVVVVAHLNKRSGDEAIYRVNGGVGNVGVARSVLVLTRDPDDPEGETGSRRLLVHAKCNVGQLAPSLIYGHEPATVTGGIETHRLVELGESDVTARQALGTGGAENLQGEAVEAICAALEGGPRRSSEVKQELRETSYSKSTIDRAAAELKASGELVIEARGDSSDGQVKRYTTWTLTSDPVPSHLTPDAKREVTGSSPAIAREIGVSGAPVASPSASEATSAERNKRDTQRARESDPDERAA